MSKTKKGCLEKYCECGDVEILTKGLQQMSDELRIYANKYMAQGDAPVMVLAMKMMAGHLESMLNQPQKDILQELASVYECVSTVHYRRPDHPEEK